MGSFEGGVAGWYEEGGENHHNKCRGKKHGGSAMGVAGSELRGVSGPLSMAGSGGGCVVCGGKEVLAENVRSGGVPGEVGSSKGGDVEWYEEGGKHQQDIRYGKKHGGSAVGGCEGGGVERYGDGGAEKQQHIKGRQQGGSSTVGGDSVQRHGEGGSGLSERGGGVWHGEGGYDQNKERYGEKHDGPGGGRFGDSPGGGREVVHAGGRVYDVLRVAEEKFIICGGDKVPVLSVPVHEVVVVVDGEQLATKEAGCEEFVVIGGVRYDVTRQVGSGGEEDAARWWEMADSSAGADTDIQGEWWLSSVHAGLSIPTLDATPQGSTDDINIPDGISGSTAAVNEGASWLRHDRWKDWIASPFYRKIVLYKLRGELFFLDPSEDIGRNEARAIRRKSHRYVMAEASTARLFYREKTGRLSVCVLETEVPKVCHSLHDVHGHFATGITVGRAYGEYYWPTRDRDIAHWVQTCIHCQRYHTKLRTAELRPILQFKPMDMLAIDYIGPITPACKGSGAKYILVMVDYYSRFVFAQPVQCADQATTMATLLNTVVPVVGWPRTIYSNNGSHFVGKEIEQMFKDHGVVHFNTAISHPSSVGLAERYVRMIIGSVRLQCLQAGSTDFWSHYVRNAVININTRCVRVHGFTPAEILLGFNPSVTQRAELASTRQWVAQSVSPGEVFGVESEELESYIVSRDDKGVTMTDKRVRHQADSAGRRKDSPRFVKARVGDLVLVRDIALSRQHGRKLDTRWSTPRIVDSISASGVSADVLELHHAPGKGKRYHVEDLLVYTPRDNLPMFSTQPSPAVEYSRHSMGAQEAFIPGQRAFHLTV
jgi:transposase InsO family protein